MRLFIGIPLIQTLRWQIDAWREPFDSLPVRWIDPQDLHVTLVPPWEEENAEGASDLLRNFRFQESFEVQFTRVSLGPTERDPRLIWATGEAGPSLSALQRELLQLFGKGAEAREFLLHATLARFNRLRGNRMPDFPQPQNWQMKPESVALYESLGGSRYRILQAVKIGENSSENF